MGRWSLLWRVSNDPFDPLERLPLIEFEHQLPTNERVDAIVREQRSENHHAVGDNDRAVLAQCSKRLDTGTDEVVPIVAQRALEAARHAEVAGVDRHSRTFFFDD